MPTKTTTKRPAPRRRRPTHEEISRRAYFIALDEGRADQLENWLQAEQELAAPRARSARSRAGA